MKFPVRILSLIVIFIVYCILTLVYMFITQDTPVTASQERYLTGRSLIVDLKLRELETVLNDQKEIEQKLFQHLDSTKKNLQLFNQSIILPVLVLACNRPDYLDRTLSDLIKYSADEYLPYGVEIKFVVSQDCEDARIPPVVHKYGNRLQLIKQPNQTKIEIQEKNKKMVTYYNLSRHFKWALSQMFANYSLVIIVEDDLSIAPDFFEYLVSSLRVMRKDPTIWCVSAWNDNGKTDRIFKQAEDLLYRTDFFPGLGWLMEKKIWLELEEKWPAAYWDDWLRLPAQRKDRVCIRPEISRTSTFGKVGTSTGQFFDKYLQHIKHNRNFVPFSLRNLSYLLQENYDPAYLKSVYSSALITAEQLMGGQSLPPSSSRTYRIQYNDKGDFQRIAKLFGLMDDFKAGVPRTGYKGIVTFAHGNRRIHLSPPQDWKGYDVTWT